MQTARFEVYQGNDGWRWRLRARNGRIVATGEAHTRERDAVRAAEMVYFIVIGAVVERKVR